MRKTTALDPKDANPWIGLGKLLQDHVDRCQEAEDAYRHLEEDGTYCIRQFVTVIRDLIEPRSISAHDCHRHEATAYVAETPVFSPSTFVHGCPHPANRCVEIDPEQAGYQVFSISASDPTEYLYRSLSRSTDCCPPEGETCRRSRLFSTGRDTFKVCSTRYLCTSPAYLTDGSTRLLPGASRGSILGARRTITQAALAPEFARLPTRRDANRTARAADDGAKTSEEVIRAALKAAGPG